MKNQIYLIGLTLLLGFQFSLYSVEPHLLVKKGGIKRPKKVNFEQEGEFALRKQLFEGEMLEIGGWLVFALVITCGGYQVISRMFKLDEDTLNSLPFKKVNTEQQASEPY